MILQLHAKHLFTFMQNDVNMLRKVEQKRDLLVQGVALLAGILQPELQFINLLLHTGKGGAVLRDKAAHVHCSLLCNAVMLLHLLLLLLLCLSSMSMLETLPADKAGPHLQSHTGSNLAASYPKRSSLTTGSADLQTYRARPLQMGWPNTYESTAHRWHATT